MASFGGGAAASSSSAFQDDMYSFLDADEHQQLSYDEDDGYDSEFRRQKDLKIYLIDAHAAMAETPAAGGASPLQLALSAVAQVLTDQIISTENDLVGVCLYGTEKNENPNSFANIYVLQQLEIPDANRIKELRDMSRPGSTRLADIGSLRSTSFEFDKALWTCQTMFQDNQLKNPLQSIHIMTNMDDPSCGDHSLLQQSVQKGRDLESTGIETILYKMPGSGFFRTGNFFKQLMQLQHEDDPKRVLDGSTSAKVQESIRKRQFALRARGNLLMSVCDDVAIAVSIYSLVQKVSRPTAVKLESDTNKPVKTETSQVCETTGNILQQNQIAYSYAKYGGATNVVFDKEEQKDLKSFGNPAIKVLGFKPRSSLKLHHNIKHSMYLRANEDLVAGSTTTILALVEQMVLRDKAALASVVIRRSSMPRLAMLMPHKETDGGGGFHLIWLPYNDDLRTLTLPPLSEPTEHAVKGARMLVEGLRIKAFDCRNYSNPALQKHFRNLETLALEESVALTAKDDLVPEEPAVPKAEARQLCAEFRNSTLGRDWEMVRDAPVKTKRTKVDTGIPVADMDWKGLVTSGEIRMHTAPTLKAYLKLHHLPVGGRKEDLVSRVITHVQEAYGTANVNGDDDENDICARNDNDDDYDLTPATVGVGHQPTNENCDVGDLDAACAPSEAATAATSLTSSIMLPGGVRLILLASEMTPPYSCPS
eukprot:SAG11_NODE_80_length_17731_cov_13.985254_3_plen_707_part_00